MSDPIDPATSPAATTAVVDPAATAPAPAVGASEPPAKKPGFLARLTGAADESEKLRGDLQAEKDAHAVTAGKLLTAEGQIKVFGEMEAKAEAKFDALTKERDDAKAEVTRLQGELTTAKQTAATATANAGQKVSAQVKDTVAALGIDPEALPAASAAPDKPGQGGEFGHLKGLDRTRAAFDAQFAGK